MTDEAQVGRDPSSDWPDLLAGTPGRPATRLRSPGPTRDPPPAAHRRPPEDPSIDDAVAAPPSAQSPPSRAQALRARLERLILAAHTFRAWPRAPLALLGAVSLLSLGARIYRLDDPYDSSTHTGGLIFDEKYYVNAARVILRIPIPCHSGGGCDPYSTIAGGHDPNSEHPPLGKLIIAAGMKALGDNPIGWRIFPVIFGCIAIGAMYWLVRSAGGGGWLALGAAALMAVDNLSMLHGRIATLDVFVVVFMLVAAGLYLRGRPVVAGVVLGVGCCIKLVAPQVLIALLLIEALRVVAHREWRLGWRVPTARALPLLYCGAAATVVYLGLLEVLDLAVRPYHDPGDANCPGPGDFTNALTHTRFMLCYAGRLVSPRGPVGIESYPWQWLLNESSINYYSVTVTETIGSDKLVHPLIAFQGLMNPAIILLTLPALGVAVATLLRERDDISALAIAWCLGTFLPFVALAWFGHRKSYLYYMVVVLPGVYIAVARLLSRRLLARAALAGYVCILGYEFWTLYPFRTWF